MKGPRLLWILAAVLVLVPAALPTVQERPFPETSGLRRRRPCPGCWSAFLVDLPSAESTISVQLPDVPLPTEQGKVAQVSSDWPQWAGGHPQEVPFPGSSGLRRRRPCPGCWSVVASVDRPRLPDVPLPTEQGKEAQVPSNWPQWAREHPQVDLPSLRLPDDPLRTELGKGARVSLDWPQWAGGHPQGALRARREERRAAPARRKGKWLGTRPVCRGCFSGLMLVGRPAEGGGAEGALPKKSLSEESGEDSGGED